MNHGALAGLRILDLTTEMGIYGTKLIADLGADVIRIEPPAGDPVRVKGHSIDGPGGERLSLYHLYMNTSKRSVTLDMSTPEGREIFLRMAATAHAVIQSGLPGPLEAAGLSYRDLVRVNPSVVYTRITPFGDDGPWAGYVANDLVLMATGGLMWLGGDPDREPLAAAGEQAYIVAGLHAATATMVALHHQELTGEGQEISLSVQECVATTLENAIQFADLEGTIRRRTGAAPRESATGLYPSADGYVYVMAGRLSTPRGWQSLVEWLVESNTPGAEELTQPQWQEYQYRSGPEATRRFGEIFTAFSSARGKRELYEEGQRRGIIVGEVNTLADLPDDRQLAHRQYFIPSVAQQGGPELLFPGAPYRLSGTPWAMYRTAPQPGQDNLAILPEVGVDRDRLAELHAKGVI